MKYFLYAGIAAVITAISGCSSMVIKDDDIVKRQRFRWVGKKTVSPFQTALMMVCKRLMLLQLRLEKSVTAV